MTGYAITIRFQSPTEARIYVTIIIVAFIIIFGVSIRQVVLRRRSPQKQEKRLLEIFSQGREEVKVDSNHYSISQERMSEIAEQHGYTLVNTDSKLRDAPLYTYRVKGICLEQ